MAQFPGFPNKFEYSNEDQINNIGRIGRRESPGHSGVFLRHDYLETYNFGRMDAQSRSNTIPNELKKRVEAAAKEFNFTMADIGRVEKALHDQKSIRKSGKEANLVQDDVKIRVAAAINKYKFTPEEIATIQKAVRDQKSMNSVNNANMSSCASLNNTSMCSGSAFRGSGLIGGFGTPSSGHVSVDWSCNIL